jgi:phospholipase/carboxylesterase
VEIKTVADLLETIEKTSGPNPLGTVIWLHGLGADANDFVPVVPELGLPLSCSLRFVFPDAPVVELSVYGGQPLQAWFDIRALGNQIAPDERGVRTAAAAITALIARENARGVPTSRIALAGFSQGGAIAVFTALRHDEPLAGIMGLSCFEVLEATLDAERTPANQETPVFLAHGTSDPMVPFDMGSALEQRLKARGYHATLRRYSMAHSVCAEEIADISRWLQEIFAS